MIPTWGTSTGRNGAGGIPSLLLDFSNQSYLLNGTGYAAFGGSPGITFSRGTNATMIDSTGKLTFAPSNQILNSESFTATTWVKTTSNVTSNATVAPDGTTTADKLLADSTAATLHYISSSISAQSGVNYTYSLYVKAAELSQVSILIPTAIVGATTQVTFDTATIPASVIGTVGSPLWSSITAVGNGWYRVALGVAATATASGGAQIKLAKAGSNSFDGIVTEGLYIWGAQLGAVTYETAPRAYNSTTPKNLLGFTEEFNNAAWNKSGINSPTANATIDPNGFLNADKIVEDLTTGEHYIDQNFAIVTGNIYTFSSYLKAGERNQAILRFTSAGSWSGGGTQVVFTLTGSGSSSLISGAPLTTSITAVGNGWYRCSISALTIVATSPAARLQMYNGSTNSYAGDGTSGFYAWGAQVSDSASVDPYVYNPAAAIASAAYYGPRFDYNPNYAYTAGNLITRANPQDFSNASFWAKSQATAPATTATIDPAGTYTAYKLTESAAGPSGHLIIWQGVGTQVVLGTEYTISGYVKLADAARPSVNVFTNTDNGAFTVNGGTVNLSTGAVTSPIGSGITVVDAGNGWWRWAITTTATASAGAAVRLYLLNAVGNNTYTGDGTSGVYIWGAQLVAAAAPVPFYYYPLNPLGLLIEEARTNLIFPSDANAGWSASPGSSLVVTANAATSPDGTTNATKLATGDTSANGHVLYKTFTGAVSTTYCGSAYLKAGEYTRAQIDFENTGFGSTIYGAVFDLAAGTVVVTNGGSTATITAVGNGWYRCTITGTTAAISGNFVFVLSPKPASVTTINEVYIPTATGLGVYVYGAQVEAGSFATSYIPTAGASVTRSADVATMVGNNFSNWYNQTTGTLAVAFDASANSNATYVSASNGSIVQNSIHIDNDSGNMRAVYYSGSALVAALGLGAIGTAGTANKIATAYAVNDFAASRNGGTVATDTSGALPVSLTQLNIGVDDRLSAIYYTSNHIKSISYYNTRLTNSQLQAVSA